MKRRRHWINTGTWLGSQCPKRSCRTPFQRSLFPFCFLLGDALIQCSIPLFIKIAATRTIHHEGGAQRGSISYPACANRNRHLQRVKGASSLRTPGHAHCACHANAVPATRGGGASACGRRRAPTASAAQTRCPPLRQAQIMQKQNWGPGSSNASTNSDTTTGATRVLNQFLTWLGFLYYQINNDGTATGPLGTICLATGATIGVARTRTIGCYYRAIALWAKRICFIPWVF